MFSENLIEVLAASFAVVEAGGLSGTGPERGRNFESLFYALCNAKGVRLCERAGSKSLAEYGSASGLLHEVDAGSRSAGGLTHWELKHLTTPVGKNELLIFNGKGLDFLQGAPAHIARTPVRRFLLSGGDVRDDCRRFAVLWGVVVVEPFRFPLPLLYEAVARGAGDTLTDVDRDAVQDLALWGCRPLQHVLAEMHRYCGEQGPPVRCGPRVNSLAREVLDLQVQVGKDVLDRLDDLFPDWIDRLAEEMWSTTGGW